MSTIMGGMSDAFDEDTRLAHALSPNRHTTATCPIFPS